MEIVEAARACIGTPFVPGGRLPGVGLDCLGLVVIAGRHTEKIPSRLDLSAWETPEVETASARLAQKIRRLEPGEVAVGDVGVFDIRGRAHLGILAGRSIIHASTLALQVVEVPLDGRWASRLHSVFRLEVVGG